MTARVNLGKACPNLYQQLAQLDKLATEAATSANLAAGLTHLLRLRASQINGCAFCIRMHTRDALASGETSDRISVLPAWRETSYFNAKERAALALVEALTLVAEGQLADEVYQEAAASLTQEEIAAIEWLTIVINAWNRVAVASRYPVGE